MIICDKAISRNDAWSDVENYFFDGLQTRKSLSNREQHTDNQTTGTGLAVIASTVRATSAGAPSDGWRVETGTRRGVYFARRTRGFELNSRRYCRRHRLRGESELRDIVHCARGVYKRIIHI